MACSTERANTNGKPVHISTVTLSKESDKVKAFGYQISPHHYLIHITDNMSRIERMDKESIDG